MENLLQGSINTDVVSQTGPGLESQDYVNDKLSQKLESVRFAPESDNEDKPVCINSIL